MIELLDVSKTYHEGRPNAFQALSGVTLAIARGQVTVLHGPSGSGKSTLLTLIGCLARPTAGRVRLAGEDISGLPERFLTGLRRRQFGFVFQQFHLIAGLDVLANVLTPALPLGQPHASMVQRAAALLDELQMTHRIHAKVQTLSGGEQQRVAIARALMNQPQVLIADEPTANLDTQLSREFMAIMTRLRDEGVTIVLSSHDPLVLEHALVQQRIGLRDGRVVQEG